MREEDKDRPWVKQLIEAYHSDPVKAFIETRFKGTYIANNGYDLALANQTIESGAADMIAFGKPFISNPDLVERLKAGAPLNDWDKNTFYGGGAKGYTDYPTLKQSQAAE